ncbi:hypothetical protein HDU99_001787 [Rhizoclosmatium hyalinum]|nr:hypothetical protein HDU99_001787 [Rhizoclosmatium hyalinum]
MSNAKLECFNDILFPNSAKAAMAEEKNSDPVDSVAWNQKKKVLFWRGSIEGGQIYVADWADGPKWDRFHRIRLVEWATQFGKKYPRRVFDAGKRDRGSILGPIKVDIGFSEITPCDEKECREIRDKYPLKHQVPFQSIIQFKYLLVLDKDTLSHQLMSYLASNSVVLYSGVFKDWMTWQFRPWIHYVPVKSDFSDLSHAGLLLLEYASLFNAGITQSD